MSAENARLTSAERATLRADIDPEALDRLLARVPAEHRAEWLSFFQVDNPQHRTVLGAQDPTLDALIKEVWAPHRSLSGWSDRSPASRASRPLELIVAAGELPGGAGAIVERNSTGEVDRIVLSPTHATDAQVFEAYRALAADRLHHPELVARSIPVPPAPALPHTPAGRQTAAWLQRYLGSPTERLRAALPETVPGHGTIRRVVLDVAATTAPEAPPHGDGDQDRRQ